jgi:hypothetical protein
MNFTRVVCSGKTYDNRQYIKDQGFRWEPKTKEWWKNVPDQEIDLLVDQFKDECPDVILQCDVSQPSDKGPPEEEVPF